MSLENMLYTGLAALLTGLGTFYGTRAIQIKKTQQFLVESGNGHENGNGKLTATQLRDALSIHAQVCGGRIEAKIDNISKRFDEYTQEVKIAQHDQWDRLNNLGNNIADCLRVATVNSTRIQHLENHAGRG